MATYTPTAPVDRINHGHKPPAPPRSGGGGDNRGGEAPSYYGRLRRARLGLVCGVATVGMVFISLTSAYVFRRGLPTFDGTTNSYVRDWGQVEFPWTLLAVNTALLLLSSLTVEFARRSTARQAALAPAKSIPGVSIGRERSFPWLGVTVLLGSAFLVGQWMAWGELHNRGFYVDTNPSSSFAFLLTIAHAIHLAGGVIALLWAGTTSLLRRPVESRLIVVDITAWYWHFMAVLWLYVFALLAFAR
jgi:cytochrome c oxidase subunit 3